MLEAGMKALDFTLQDKDGNTVSLSDFAGKKVVIYFYPRDNTPGCTRQACAFAASYEEFRAKDVVVIGISKDSVASHQKFAAKHDLPLHPALRPGAHRHPGLWRVAGKEALWQGEHGCCAHYVCRRRERRYSESDA